MGKATKWLRSIFGSSKKPLPESSPPLAKEKRSKWGLTKTYSGQRTNRGYVFQNDDPSSSPYVESDDASKHAVAVAAATAAVAEAALAAAQAAAEVVRLTSGSGSRSTAPSTAYLAGDRRRHLAAVRIQSSFRSYLARRALRALKGLVRLQALVRGRIVRKQSADMLRRMHAMARIQARACAHRAYTSEVLSSNVKVALSDRPDIANFRTSSGHQRANNAKYKGPNLKKSRSKPNTGQTIGMEGRQLGLNWLDRWMEECTWNDHNGPCVETRKADDEKSDKILEVDTWKPQLNPKPSNRMFQTSHYFSAWNYRGQEFTEFESSRHSEKLLKPNPSISSGEITSLRSLNFPPEVDQVASWAAENSPKVHSASSRPGSSRKGPFTPTRSEYSRSVFGDYMSHPNYMANTESSRAKVRSHSAPRQRMQFEEHNTSRKLASSLWDADTRSENGSFLGTNRKSKAYPFSGHYTRPQAPIQRDPVNFTSTHGYRR